MAKTLLEFSKISNLVNDSPSTFFLMVEHQK
jgi:hypothetical protein